MSANQNAYWERIYTKAAMQLPVYDGWLDKYIPALRQCQKIVDLGCGVGVNTLYLHNLDIQTTACDFSQSALHELQSRLPDAPTLCFDMTKGLPFLPESTDAVIADLSLHYFSDAMTKQIIADIKRILRPGGMLLCRVNAYEDGFDPSAHEKIEQDYYVVNECTKRFFTPQTLRSYFSGWEIMHVEEQKTEKYGFVKPAILIEIRK